MLHGCHHFWKVPNKWEMLPTAHICSIEEVITKPSIKFKQKILETLSSKDLKVAEAGHSVGGQHLLTPMMLG